MSKIDKWGERRRIIQRVKGRYVYSDLKIKNIFYFRITKPGGHLCFTNFIEPSGKFIGMYHFTAHREKLLDENG